MANSSYTIQERIHCVQAHIVRAGGVHASGGLQLPERPNWFPGGFWGRYIHEAIRTNTSFSSNRFFDESELQKVLTQDNPHDVGMVHRGGCMDELRRILVGNKLNRIKK